MEFRNGLSGDLFLRRGLAIRGFLFFSLGAIDNGVRVRDAEPEQETGRLRHLALAHRADFSRRKLAPELCPQYERRTDQRSDIGPACGAPGSLGKGLSSSSSSLMLIRFGHTALENRQDRRAGGVVVGSHLNGTFQPAALSGPLAAANALARSGFADRFCHSLGQSHDAPPIRSSVICGFANSASTNASISRNSNSWLTRTAAMS